MRAIRWIIPLFVAVSATPLIAQVFGMTAGKTAADYDTTLDHVDGAYDWHVIRPPQPDPQFERYETNSVKGLGICRVSAITRSFKANETAGLIALSNRLHKQLNAAYGLSESYGEGGVKVPDYWIGKAEVPQGQFKDPEVVISFWMPKIGSKMPAGLDSAVLLLMEDEGKNTRSIMVIYSFPNNDECVRRYRKAKGE